MIENTPKRDSSAKAALEKLVKSDQTTQDGSETMTHGQGKKQNSEEAYEPTHITDSEAMTQERVGAEAVDNITTARGETHEGVPKIDVDVLSITSGGEACMWFTSESLIKI